MTLRKTPKAATWFLKQFGSQSIDETVVGDLTEQYQRGYGSIWYWRQVLVIMFVGIYREALRNKRNVVVGLFQSWCVWGCLQFAAAVVLMTQFVLRHPEQLRDGISVYGLPMLTLHSRMTVPYSEQVEITILSVFLNVFTLLATGYVCSRRSSRISPQTVLLAFVTTYVIVNAGMTIAVLLQIALHQPYAEEFLLARFLITLPLAPALILVGGMRKSISRRERVVRSTR